MGLIHLRSCRVLLGVGGAAVMLLVPTTVLADMSIQIGSTQMVAKGVAVDATVTFTCAAGDVIQSPFDLSVYIQQAVSKTQQATGIGYVANNVTCTGAPQSALIQVLANSSGPPFKIGVAAANASIQDCSLGFPCSTATSGLVTVRLTNN